MSRRSLSGVAVTLLAFLALTATAWAYFGAAGSGSSSGSADVARQVVINAGAAPQATLLPTGTATGTLTLSVHNPTASPLRFESLVLDTTEGTGGYSAEAVRCQVAYAAQSGTWTVAAGSTLHLSLPGSLAMGTDAPSDCQGSDVAVYLKTA